MIEAAGDGARKARLGGQARVWELDGSCAGRALGAVVIAWGDFAQPGSPWGVSDKPMRSHRHISSALGLLIMGTPIVGCFDGDTGSSATSGNTSTGASAATGSASASGASGESSGTSTTGGGESTGESTAGSTSGSTGGSTSGSTEGSTGGTTGEETQGTTGELCEPEGEPLEVDPCGPASCWSALTFSAICGPTTIAENYASGAFNVHAFTLAVRAEVTTRITFSRTGGEFDPALIIRDSMGETLFDGEVGACGEGLAVVVIDAGEDTVSVELTSATDRELGIFLTGWQVVDGGFAPAMPTDATYIFEIDNLCDPETGASDPPNFDEDDLEGGFYVLPDAEPPGLYTHKDPDCSRGTRRMIQVLHTVAERWQAIRPEFAPINILDLNEAWCSTVDHATHDDGTHADLKAGCATNVDCENWIPALDLARLFVDTGEVCGILFNDAKVQAEANPYFEEGHDYEPWKQVFMRTVDGHVAHFHVRVKKPGGTCN